MIWTIKLLSQRVVDTDITPSVATEYSNSNMTLK
jgi:hypothetical protein